MAGSASWQAAERCFSSASDGDDPWGVASSAEKLIDVFAEDTGFDASSLREILNEVGGSEREFFAILSGRGIATEERCYRAWARCLGLPFHSLDERSLGAAALHRLPLDVARQYGAVVVREDQDALEVVLFNPFDILAVDAIQEITRKAVQPAVATPQAIHKALDRQSRGQTGIEGLIVQVGQSGGDLSAFADTDRLKKVAGDDAVVQLVDYLVDEALRAGASDIHFEPQRGAFRVRIRIDGELETLYNLPNNLQAPVSSRVKVVSGLDISERRRPQDGRFVVTKEGKQTELRVSTLPTVFGEKVVCRILDRSAVELDLDALGFSAHNLSRFRSAIRCAHGMVLVTGPTGSGKTTTLYAALREISTDDVNVVTVEDPVEYDLPGTAQVQVDVKADRTFAKALRSILRQDPDVVMVGEIRDAETAHIAVQAALTGHLVLSTLHTNDAPGAVHRLLDMGVEPYLLAPALRCVVAQRLVACVCPSCVEPVDADPETLRALGVDETSARGRLMAGKGCPECRNRGRRGRVPLHEVLMVDNQIRGLIARRAEADAFLKAAGPSYRPMVRDGLDKAFDGRVPIEEVLGAVRMP